jgi:hypothetical protein
VEIVVDEADVARRRLGGGVGWAAFGAGGAGE